MAQTTRISTVEIGQVSDVRNLSAHLVFTADPERRLSAADIARQGDELPWQQSPDEVPNLGLNAPPIGLR